MRIVRWQFAIAYFAVLQVVPSASGEIIWVRDRHLGGLTRTSVNADAYVPDSANRISEPWQIDEWASPDAIAEAKGENWQLLVDEVWLRYPVPDSVGGNQRLSIPVFGELIALYADEDKIDLDELTPSFQYYSVDAARIEDHRFIYILVSDPSVVGWWILHGPTMQYDAAISRAAATSMSSVPGRVEWTVYDNDTRVGDRIWQPQTGAVPELNRKQNLAVRFRLPDRYAEPALIYTRPYGVDRVEVIVDDRPHFASGYDGTIAGPGAESASWFLWNHAVMLPAEGGLNIEIRWSFLGRRLVVETDLRFANAVLFGPAKLVFLRFYEWSSPMLRLLGPAATTLLAIVLFGAGVSKRGAGRRSFFILSALALAVSISTGQTFVENLFMAVSILRYTPPMLIRILVALCEATAGPLAYLFVRLSIKGNETNATRLLSRIVYAAAACSLVYSVFETILAFPRAIQLLGESADLLSIGFAGAAIAGYTIRSDERGIKLALGLSVILGTIFGTFDFLVRDADVIDLFDRSYYLIRSVLFVSIFLPMVAVPLQVHRRIENELREANVVFRRFVPDEFLKFLGIDNIREIVPGRQIETDLTLMFCDIRSFTSISEKLRPERVMTFINNYLDYAGPIIRRHSGFIDKYLGDGIMAIFPREGADAGLAALEIADGTPKVDSEIGAQIGIGLHRGPAMLGTIGEHDRLDTTVLSDAVNTASRLQALSADYGADVLASESVAGYEDNAGAYYQRFVDRVRFKGKDNPIEIFQLMPINRDDSQVDADNSYLEAFRLLSIRDIAGSRQLLDYCLSVDSADRIYRMFAERIDYLANEGFPPEWDGTTTRNRK